MTDIKKIIVHTDGGSRNNPGPAAIGIYICDQEGKDIYKLGKQIGIATNNVAEYTAVIEALSWIVNNLDTYRLVIEFYLDSLLVVNQLNGVYKIKDENLKKLIIKAKQLEKEILGEIKYCHVPREKNKVADFLLNSSF